MDSGSGERQRCQDVLVYACVCLRCRPKLGPEFSGLLNGDTKLEQHSHWVSQNPAQSAQRFLLGEVHDYANAAFKRNPVKTTLSLSD